MTKFWFVVTALLLTGIGLLVFAPEEDPGINFTDLETECRYDRGTSSVVDLTKDNSLSFEGYFPTESPGASMGYSYSQSEDRVTLNIQTSDSVLPTTFWDTCKASVIYSAETQSLQDGSYLVTVQHNGQTVDQKVIKIG